MRALCVGALLCLVVAVGLAVTVLWPGDRPFQEMRSRLRAAGEPCSFEELIPDDVPPQENGVAEFEAAMAWLDETAGGESQYGVVGPWDQSVEWPWWEHATPEQMARLTDFLDRVGGFLDRVEAAVRKPRIVFRLVRDQRGVPWAPHLPRVQRLRRLLFAFGVAARDPASRLRAIRAQADFTAAHETQGVIEPIVALDMAHGAANQVRIGIEQGAWDAEAAHAALRGAFEEDWYARVPLVLRWERTFLVEAFDAILRGRWPEPSLHDRIVQRIVAGNGRPLARDMVDAVAEQGDLFTELARVPISADPAYLAQMERRLATSPLPLFTLAWPKLLFVRMHRTTAADRLARIALALAAHRARTGGWPDSLDAIAPEFEGGIPADPFGGAFRYERTDMGVRLSSAAPLPADEDDGTPGARDEWLREKALLWELR